MTDKPTLFPVYAAARAVIDFMDAHDGACQGILLQTLRNAIVETDELLLPEFLRRKRGWQPDEKREVATSTEGLEDLL